MDAGRIGVLFGLFFFGLAYNALVSWLGERKEGYTAYLVAGGVLVTMAGLGLAYSWEAALWALFCFMASGIPMMAGEAWRHAMRRWEALEEARAQALAEAQQALRSAQDDHQA